MTRLTSRVVRLEDAAPNSWRAWWRVPVRQWPDHALIALVNAGQGWPDGYVPSDNELRAVIGEDSDHDADNGDAP